MDRELKFEVWSTNKFNDDILKECVGKFYNREMAEKFVEYMATEGENCIVKERK